ncbi:MAG TPA: methyl-accepting chemotaxis protein [Rariglobus sp.]
MKTPPSPRRIQSGVLSPSIVRLLAGFFLCAWFPPCLQAATSLTAGQAIKALQEGNARFNSARSIHPDQGADRRIEVAKGQNPFATILTCSDSRLPAELIFDQGLGDLFVVRVAGNVAKTDEIGSMEYGTDHLGSPLLVVMGHSSCGAVKAVAEGAKVHGNIPQLVDTIGSAVARTKAAHPGWSGGQLIAGAVEENVWQSIDNIFENSATIRDLVKAGKLRVVGAVYDLETGAVEWRGEHPDQARLLAYTGGEGHEGHEAHDGALSAHAPDSASAPEPVAVPPVEHATSLGYPVIGAGALIMALLLAGVHYYSRTGMQRKTVNVRLALGFTGVLIVLAGLGVESYLSLHTALGDFAEYRQDARHSNLAAGIQAQYLEMRIAAKDLVIYRSPETVGRYDLHKAKLMGFLDEGLASLKEPELQVELKTVKDRVSTHAGLHKELQAAVFAGRHAVAEEINKKMGAIGTVIERETDALEARFVAQQNQDGPRIAAELQHTQSSVVWISIAAVVLGVSLAAIIARSITGPLQRLATSLGAGANETAAAAGQVSAASQSLAEGASEQAASLEETSASLEELSSMTKRNAESSQNARAAASGAKESADAGAGRMQAMQEAMHAINSASVDITKILKTIDEIAFQTNILALNAAVEAARAGEHGAGFAVVAEEVRALAQRSASAAKETAAKIEHSVGQSEQGVRISGEVAKSFGDIQVRIQQLESIVAEIAGASGEQNQGIGQVASAVSQMDQVTQTNAGSAEETAAAAEELNSQSLLLKQAVDDLRRLVGGRGDPVSDTPSVAVAAPARKKSNPPVRMPARSVKTAAGGSR